MKAFWTIRANVNGAPDLPALAGMTVINPCDIWLLPAGAGAANHIHTLAGTMSFPSFQVASRHTHSILKTPGDNAVHFFFHESEAAHTHPDPVLSYFMCFVRCSDADFVTLTNAPYNVRVIAQATINIDPDTGGESTGTLDTTPWTSQQRTLWANAALSQMGIALPAQIDRGARLVALFSQMFLARFGNDERGLRG